MNCEEVRTLLSALLDHELELTKSIELERHLETCLACQQRWQALKSLSSVLQEQKTQYVLPLTVDRELQDRLQAQRNFRPKPITYSTFWLGAVAGIIVCFLSLQLLPQQSNSPATELMNLHLRSLQANHLLDLPSSEHHVIKPWLAGKIDFSLDPKDFNSEGFTLLGSRMDYFQDQPAVCLVYQFRNHIINVVVQRDGSRDFFSARKNSINGFNFTQWKKDGLHYSAISDASLENMSRLQSLLIQM